MTALRTSLAAYSPGSEGEGRVGVLQPFAPLSTFSHEPAGRSPKRPAGFDVLRLAHRLQAPASRYPSVPILHVASNRGAT